MNNGGVLALMVLGSVLLISSTSMSIFIGVVIVLAVVGVAVFRLRTRRVRRELK